MPEIVCTGCRHKIHPPDRLAGRKVTCPRCEAVLTVPLQADSDEELPTSANVSVPETEPEDPPLPAAARYGIIATVLGCVSVMILCLPFIGYASFVLSAIGLPLAIWGWFRAHVEGDTMITRTPNGAGIIGSFGTRSSDYPLAGMVACLLALGLALLPILLR